MYCGQKILCSRVSFSGHEQLPQRDWCADRAINLRWWWPVPTQPVPHRVVLSSRCHPLLVAPCFPTSTSTALDARPTHPTPQAPKWARTPGEWACWLHPNSKLKSPPGGIASSPPKPYHNPDSPCLAASLGLNLVFNHVPCPPAPFLLRLANSLHREPSPSLFSLCLLLSSLPLSFPLHPSDRRPPTSVVHRRFRCPAPCLFISGQSLRSRSLIAGSRTATSPCL